MGRQIFPDNQAFTFYDRKKFPRLSFEAGDEPVRAERIDDWLTELDMALSDRMKKFHPGSPMSGLLTKAPLLWGRQYGGAVDWTGDLSIPRELKTFQEWRDLGPYDGFKELEELELNVDATDFVDVKSDNGSVRLTVEQQQERFIRTFFPFCGKEKWAKLFEKDKVNEDDVITLKSPATFMIECIRCIGPVILQTIEPNSKNSVVQGDAANLEEYVRAMKEQHCRAGGFNEVLRSFCLMKSFSFGRFRGMRASNSYDNIAMILREFIIAHPKKGRYPEGTKLGNVTSLRCNRYSSESPEKWSPFMDIIAVYFVVGCLSAAQLEEIAHKIAKKSGCNFSEVGMRDLCNEKRFVFDEYDRMVNAKGHAQLKHLLMAADFTWQFGDIKSALDKIQEEYAQCSVREKPKVNAVQDDLESTKGVFEEEDTCNQITGGNRNGQKLDARTALNNTRYIVNTSSGEVYAKTNLVLNESELKRVNTGMYKKAFHLFNGPRKQNGGRPGTRSKEIVKRAMKKSHKVRGGRQQNYRAFAIDQSNGECSVQNTMLDELNRLELMNDDGSEYEDNVEMVEEEEVDSDYSTNGIGGSKAKVASGGSMAFENYEADFDLEFNSNLNLRFRKAKVFKSEGNTFILGKNGFVMNRIEMVIRQDELKILINGSQLDNLWNNLNSVPINKLKRNDGIFSIVLTEEKVVPLEKTPTLHEHIWEKSSSIFENMPPCRAFNPDGEKAWSRKLERIHQEMRNKNTVDEFVIDPNENVLDQQNGEKIKKRLRSILQKYRSVFEGSIGHVAGEEFVITGQIDSNKSDRSPNSAPLNYGRNLPESIQNGLENMLDELASQGVISYLPVGMEPENFLSFFGVAKQTAGTAKVELSANNIRIVVDFNRAGINDKTQYAARQADNIRRGGEFVGMPTNSTLFVS
ncbi:unnamed protein product [Oikopleura dioica]|uniref:Uncharacterized protein n=1 Tax=Oikopleura dioica TaxID=34765 RepID=E4X294_OIKDI|nr:unnamed protein product [Oikopleura dioica]